MPGPVSPDPSNSPKPIATSSNGLSQPVGSLKPRKSIVRLSPAQWAAARYDFESGKLKTKREVAASYNISHETITKRAQHESWLRNSQVASSAGKQLRDATSAALDKAAEQIAGRLSKQFEDDLRPWLEKEKRLHIKDSVKRSKARQRLMDQIVNEAEAITFRDASYIAKADDTYDAIKRRNLGLNDDKAPAGGALSINILTNQAAVSVA